MMWDRIRRDLEGGLSTFKWAGRFLAERIKVETSLAKVVYDSQKIQKKIDEKYLELGGKVFELRDDKGAIQNVAVSDIISDIESLKEDLDLHLARAKELGSDPTPPPDITENGDNTLKEQGSASTPPPDIVENGDNTQSED